MKIPPEIDSLMWDVAEEASPELMDEFAERFPEHKGELLNRIKMVRELKGARPKQAAKPAFVPKPAPFVPREPRPFQWTPTWAAVAGATLLLVGVSAGLGIASLVRSPQVQIQPPPANREVKVPTEAENAALERNTWIDPKPVEEPTLSTRPTTPDLKPFDRKITVKFERASLTDVLEAVATAAGLRLQAAPGMPEVMIAADYEDLPALAILTDLGRTCGFTPMVQTDREALLIPAMDRSSKSKPADGGSSAIQDPPPTRTDGSLPGLPNSDNSTPLSGPIGRR